MVTQADLVPDMLVERVKREGAPLIDDDWATFVWMGEEAPRLMGDFNGWGFGDGGWGLLQIAPHVWVNATQFPRDAYLEYRYIAGDEPVLDPLNSSVESNGLGGYNNALVMPEAEDKSLFMIKRGMPRGKLTRHVVEGGFLVANGRRAVNLYRPPTDEPVPLLVVFDGDDYLRRARLPLIVDNLIAQKRIQPIAMALVHHGRQARFVEYDSSEATVSFLLRNVIPLAREHLNLVAPDDVPGAYGVLGASMGGLQSMYTALRVPDIFGRVISQSGSFGFRLASHPPIVHDLICSGPRKPLKIWMGVGQYEILLDSNRAFHAALEERGYDVTYREFPGGHNYGAWRNDVWRGLEAAFPPQFGS